MTILQFAPRRAAFLLLSVLLAGCALVSPGLDEPTATPEPTATAQSLAPTTEPTTEAATALPEPTAAPSGAIAFVGRIGSALPGSVTALSQLGVETAAADNGFQVDAVDVADQDPEQAIRAAADKQPTLIVVAGADLAEATRAVAGDYPAINFIGVDQDAVDSLANYFVLGNPGNRLDEEGFLAGMLAGLSTQTRILGLVYPADTLEGMLYRNGFIHGHRYTCGQCELVEIPVPDPSDTAAGGRAADQLQASNVDVIFTAAYPGGNATLQQATTLGIKVVGLGYNFAASDPTLVLGNVVRRPDVALPPFIAAVLAGESPEPQPFSIENGSLSYDELTASPAIAAYVDNAITMLASKELETGVDPVTAEEK